jgi:hypothetical protein
MLFFEGNSEEESHAYLKEEIMPPMSRGKSTV